MNKKLILGISALILAAGAILAVKQTKAFGNPPSDMITALAQKLGIGEDKVKAAFDSIQSDKQAQRQQQIEDQLTQAVSNGKLTDAQKQLILAKYKELQAQRQTDVDNQDNMTFKQWRDTKQKEMDDLKNWAQSNNIDLTYLYGLGRELGIGKGKGMDMGMGRGIHGGWWK